MENKFARKYNTNFRKKIINKIEKINNKDYQIDIYNIIIQDIGNNFSSNRNGLFINLNLLSDNSISEINNYLENKLINIKIDNDNES
jgi:predicted site-specific integrase-resolvase